MRKYSYSLTPTTAAQPSCQTLDIQTTYPLFSPNILSVYGAIFIGLVRDEFFYADHGVLQAWQLVITNNENAVFYLNRNYTLVRYAAQSQSPFIFLNVPIFLLLFVDMIIQRLFEIHTAQFVYLTLFLKPRI